MDSFEFLALYLTKYYICGTIITMGSFYDFVDVFCCTLKILLSCARYFPSGKIKSIHRLGRSVEKNAVGRSKKHGREVEKPRYGGRKKHGRGVEKAR